MKNVSLSVKKCNLHYLFCRSGWSRSISLMSLKANLVVILHGLCVVTFFLASQSYSEKRKRCVSCMNMNTSLRLDAFRSGEATGRSCLLDVSVSICDSKIGKFENSSDKIQFPDIPNKNWEWQVSAVCVRWHFPQPGPDDDEEGEVGRRRKATKINKFSSSARKSIFPPLEKPEHNFSPSSSYFIHDALNACTGWSST